MDAALSAAVTVDTSGFTTLASVLRDAADAGNRLATQMSDAAGAAQRGEADFRGVASALTDSETRARSLSDELAESAGHADRLESEATQAASALGRADSEARGVGTGITQATRGGTGALAGLTGGAVALRGALGGVAAAAAGTLGLRAVVDYATEARDAFSALNESTNAVNVTFGDAAGVVTAFGERSAEAAGLSRASFQQAVVPIGSLLKNFGLDAGTAAQAAVDLTLRAADLASVYDTDVSQALNAIASGLRGQTEPLLAYGINLSAAQVQATALASGLVAAGGEMDNQATIQARLATLFDQSSSAAGDFANTSGELANRTRIVGEQSENTSAVLGREMLPLFEALNELTPLLTQTLRDFAPAIGSAADAISGFATDPGTLGFIQFLADLPSGFGQIVDTVKGVGGEILNVAGGALGIATGIATGNFDEFSAASDRFGTSWHKAAQSTQERIISRRLVGELRDGADATTAFANAVAGIGQVGGEITGTFVDNMIQLANLDPSGAALGLKALIDASGQLGFTADEVKVLRTALAGLDDVDTSAAATALTGLGDAAEDAAGRVATFPEAVAAAAAATEEGAARIADSLDLFSGAAEQLDVTAAGALENLRAQVTAAAEFEANVVYLLSAGFDALAGELLRQGPAAAGAAAGFVSDMTAAAEAEGLLDGVGTTAAQRVGEQLAAALAAGPVTEQTLAGFTSLADLFTSPQVTDAFLGAVTTQAASMAGGFREGVGHEFGAIAPQVGESLASGTRAAYTLADLPAVSTEALAGFIPPNIIADEAKRAFQAARLDRVAAEAFAGIWSVQSFLSGIEQQGANAANAFVKGAKGPRGFNFGSPSKVMVAMGRQLATDLGDSFASAVNLSLPSQPLSISGTLTMAGGGVDGRSAAIAGQVSGLLGTVRR